MNPVKQKEDTVLFAAIDMTDAAQRKEFLDESCAGDDALRSAVEQKLAARTETESFFAKARSALHLSQADLPVMPAQGDEIKPDERIGALICCYKLLEKIGEGGCGAVYMAEQEQPVRRRVALKVIKLGMDTQKVIARFAAERQALALMDHPNIARVLDAGATDAGRPYFVMELVRGVKITSYCDEYYLGMQQRLRLFIQVCHAIQHAHQKGIIHRDVKPSNILVTTLDGIPMPKVIDFGIAKAIEGRLTEETMQTDFTGCENIVGTPAYMSPEQAERRTLDVDTRSDIYSLGVLLYELLTGRPPFDGKTLVQSGVEHMRRTLRETEPPRLSKVLTALDGAELKTIAEHRRIEPPRLISTLAGDLERIVMMAMEKDRSRRYETVNGLLMDLQRYLNDEPVRACPPSQMYRLQKLVRRNRAVFISGGAVSVALITGFGTSTWLFLKERHARHEQERLMVQAQENERITEAAILVSRENYEDADRELDGVRHLIRPSIDGVTAYRKVAEWLAFQGQWEKAASRFLKLMEIDELDKWNIVSWDYQYYGTTLAKSGNLPKYNQFCRASIAHFSATTNSNEAWRILRSCLLMPADKDLLTSLRPLAALSESSFQSLTNNPGVAMWATIPVSLWKYRSGDYLGAEQWCRRSLAFPDRLYARQANSHLILAMSCFKLGRPDEALAELKLGQTMVKNRFPGGQLQSNASQGLWWDWVDATILLREAIDTVGDGENLTRAESDETPGQTE